MQLSDGKSSKEQMAGAGIMSWLGDTADLTTLVHSDFDVINMGLKGITKASLDKLAGYIGVTRKSMAEDILDVSVKTLERKAPSARLGKKISSHALEIARIMQHAYEVFEEENKVKLWMNRENRALNNKKPVELFDTLTGLNMVSDILARIEEGVYS